MHIVYLFGRVWLGTVHQSPSLVRYGLSSRMICADKLAEPARCDTPVPQPLSVVNSVKAKKVITVRG